MTKVISKEYLDHLRSTWRPDYVPLPIIMERVTRYRTYGDCVECKAILMDPPGWHHGNPQTCVFCFSVQDTYYPPVRPSSEECNRISSKYIRVNNFRKVIDRFQASQFDRVPQTVYDSIAQILPTNPTKKDIKVALKKLKFQEFYNDVYLIHHTLTEIPTNDISDYLERLISDFKRISDNFKGSNFYNTQYVLFALLKHYGLCFNTDEFFIPKSMNEVKDKEFNDLLLPPP